TPSLTVGLLLLLGDGQREREEREREDEQREYADERTRAAERVVVVERRGVRHAQHYEEQRDVEDARRRSVPEPAERREQEHREEGDAPDVLVRAPTQERVDGVP